MTTATNNFNNTRIKAGHRKSKLTPELIEKLSSYIAQGNYFITACNACGISDRAGYNWINKGLEDMENGEESHFVLLLQSLKRAEAEAETRRVARIEEAGIGGGLSKRRVTTFKDGTETVEETYAQPQWLADMTHLERRHPERWGRKDRSLIQIDEHKTVTITNVEVIKDYGRGSHMIVEGEAKEIPAPSEKD